MKAFAVLLLLIGLVLLFVGVGDLVTMFSRGDLEGGVGTVGLVVNGGLGLGGVLFVGLALVMRKLADREPPRPPAP